MFKVCITTSNCIDMGSKMTVYNTQCPAEDSHLQSYSSFITKCAYKTTSHSSNVHFPNIRLKILSDPYSNKQTSQLSRACPFKRHPFI
eukprot:Gb_09322 [translate_table: standard]